MTTPSIQISETAGNLQPSMTLAITSKAKTMITEGIDVISMCAGEPDFDTPDFIKAAAIKAIENGETKYTRSAGRLDLCQALSRKFKADNNVDYAAQQIIVSPGGKFSLMAAIQVLCNPGDEVIIPTPAWLSYPEMVRSTGAVPVFVETKAEDNFCLNPEDLRNAITDKTKMLIINSPSNPTGGIYPYELLKEIADVAVEKDILVISDEMYEKLVYDEGSEHFSIASMGKEIYDRTITVNGFSKAYSMTGWRLGYLGAPTWIAEKIAAFQSHATSNATSFAQAGALAALTGPQEQIEEMRLAFKKRRDLIFQLLSEIPGIEVNEPRGAFYIFPDVSAFGMDSMAFCERLLNEAHVAAIPGSPFGSPNNIRLSYACSEENIVMAARRLKDFCAKYLK